MRTGRPTKPTNLKVIQGTFRKGRAKNEATPPIEIPEVPGELSDAAKAEWGRVSQDLFQLGLLSRIDRAALAAYCEAWADYLDAMQRVATIGKVIKTGEKVIQKPDGTIEKSGGNFIENPYFSIKKRSAELMHKFLIEFGLTPASRSRINVSDEDAPKDGSKWSGIG